MMKNKGVTYALLIVVGLIWYNVFFRVKSNLFGEEEGFVSRENPIKPIASLERDTFVLKANYRDPFGGQVVRPPVDPKPETDPVVQIPRPVYQEPWPQIVYYGQIKKTGSKTPLAILKIDGMQFYLRTGENVLDNYVIRRIFKDSVEVSHGKSKRMVKVLGRK